MYIKIGNDKYPISGASPGADVVFRGVDGLTAAPTSGTVELYTDDDFLLRADRLSDFARCVLADGTLTLTNVPTPTPPTEAELLAAARAAALERIGGKCSAAIYSGITVDGKHYKLTATAQTNLATAQAKIDGGATSVIYSADGEAPALYTAAQITAISAAAYEWGVVNTSYYAALQSHIAAETDADKLKAIDYGKALPDSYMQQLAALLSSAGIDITKYTAALTAAN
jgi:hypothetical protein